MDKSEPAFLLKRILPVVWEKPIKYARYVSHHKEHEDHEGKHIILPLSLRVLRALRGYIYHLSSKDNRNSLLSINGFKPSYCCIF
jgi:hypothetical protein